MQIRHEMSEPYVYKLTMQLDTSDWKEGYDKQIRDTRKRANLPGFRPGQVPRSIIERTEGPRLRFTAIQGALDKALPEYLKEQNLAPVTRPYWVDPSGEIFQKGEGEVAYILVAVDKLETIAPAVDTRELSMSDEEWAQALHEIRRYNGLSKMAAQEKIDATTEWIRTTASPIPAEGEPKEEEAKEGEAPVDNEPKPLFINARQLAKAYRKKLEGKKVGFELEVELRELYEEGSEGRRLFEGDPATEGKKSIKVEEIATREYEPLTWAALAYFEDATPPEGASENPTSEEVEAELRKRYTDLLQRRMRLEDDLEQFVAQEKSLEGLSFPVSFLDMIIDQDFESKEPLTDEQREVYHRDLTDELRRECIINACIRDSENDEAYRAYTKETIGYIALRKLHPYTYSLSRAAIGESEANPFGLTGFTPAHEQLAANLYVGEDRDRISNLTSSVRPYYAGHLLREKAGKAKTRTVKASTITIFGTSKEQ